MSAPFARQVVIVTGEGRGLGAAIAASFVRQGAKVAVTWGRSKSPVEALMPELGENASVFQADVKADADVQRMIGEVTERFGPPTTVVHNASAHFAFNGAARKKLDEIRWPVCEAHAFTGLNGALNPICFLTSVMAASGFGCFITIGTYLFQNPVDPYHDYTAIKASLLSLTRTAAAELGPHGISLNMVSVGLLRTSNASVATPDEVFDFVAQSTSLRSVTTPAEMADAVMFFASSQARAVNGQNLIVDGGLAFN